MGLVELQLINRIIQSRDFSVVTRNGLTDKYFLQFKDEFNFIVEHYKNYGSVPDVLTFKYKFKDTPIDLDVNEAETYLIDKLYEAFDFVKFNQTLQEIGKDLSVDSRLAYEKLISKLPELRPTLINTCVDITKEGADARLEKYNERKELPQESAVIKTGFKELDEIFYGWEPGEELVTILARSNQGKCLEKGTKVRMADGSCKVVEDIQIGDCVRTIIGSNQVLGLHHGKSKGYRIVPFHGQPFVVSEGHYLTLQYFESDLNLSLGFGSLIDIKIEDYINQDEYFKKSCFLVRYKSELACDPLPELSRFQIETIDEIEYYGFACDGDHRFLLEDGTVTHNSWLALKFLAEAWKQGKRVGMYSGEMSDMQQGYRFDALFNHFSNTALRRGHEVKGYAEYIENLKKLPNPFLVTTPKDFNGMATVSKLRMFVEKNNLDILGVDQLSLMLDERASRGEQERIKLGHISADLYLLSCELKIPIIALVQANREAAKKGNVDDNTAPQLEDIRESDDIAHNSSRVISMRQTKAGLLLNVIKNRGGRNGDKLLYHWDIDTGYFHYASDFGEVEHIQPETKKELVKHHEDSTSVEVMPF